MRIVFTNLHVAQVQHRLEGELAKELAQALVFDHARTQTNATEVDIEDGDRLLTYRAGVNGHIWVRAPGWAPFGHFSTDNLVGFWHYEQN
jgi:hypothetical protein